MAIRRWSFIHWGDWLSGELLSMGKWKIILAASYPASQSPRHPVTQLHPAALEIWQLRDSNDKWRLPGRTMGERETNVRQDADKSTSTMMLMTRTLSPRGFCMMKRMNEDLWGIRHMHVGSGVTDTCCDYYWSGCSSLLFHGNNCSNLQGVIMARH